MLVLYNGIVLPKETLCPLSARRHSLCHRARLQTKFVSVPNYIFTLSKTISGIISKFVCKWIIEIYLDNLLHEFFIKMAKVWNSEFYSIKVVLHVVVVLRKAAMVVTFRALAFVT